MDVIYAKQEATAAEVLEGLPDPPSYSAVRALLRILEEKGHLKHKKEQGRYVYVPTRLRGHAAKTAIKRVLSTFFDNSAPQAIAALLDVADSKLSDSELEEMEKLIAEARKRGQQG